MKSAVRIQLSFMMFLEFFIWGAWFVTLGTFVANGLAHGANEKVGEQIGYAFLTQSIGAVIAPFIVGIIADRFISAQVILGVIHLAGAAMLWICSGMTTYDTFYPVLLVYMILYMPTLALVNAISFRQMNDPSKEFSFIRVFGTVGWIIAGLLIAWLQWEKSNTLDLTFKMAAGASILLGLFSFTLPKTPPAKKGTKISINEILGLDAIRMLKNRAYLLFFLASIAICIPLAFYYNFTNLFLNEIGMNAAAGKQTMGQMSEFLFMLVMPLFFARLGVKKMLALGMLAWVLRYVLFSFGNVDGNYWMLIIGIILHGICYDFFFVTGQIYTDKIAGEEFKSSAQGFVTLATYGVGMLIGFLISGRIVDIYQTSEKSHDWHIIWLIPAGIAAVVLVLFMLFFRDSNKEKVLKN